MVCPNCKSKTTKVYDSCSTDDQVVCRRRKCAKCRYIFRTMEILDDNSEEFNARFNQSYRVKHAPYR